MAPLLSIEDLRVDFESGQQRSTALQGISFTLQRGEILALVGESGSGKTVTSLAMLQLLPAKTVRYGGRILFSPEGGEPVDLLALDKKGMQAIRGNRIAMIFQEPMTSLNPVFSCGEQVMESIRQHQGLGRRESSIRMLELFEKVRLPQPAQIARRYPHQLSGGQKQRVMIAMAISCQPDLLICDEPTTALDVTVQKTILELIRELQQSQGMAVLFITHDLGLVGELASRVLVMYQGRVVESGPVGNLLNSPQHPYTKGLLACRPALHPRGQRLPVIGDFLDPGTAAERVQKDKLAATPATPSPGAAEEILLKAENLSVWFRGRKKLWDSRPEPVKAVDGINLEIFRGETLGLVGESGCGKSTLGRALLRLQPLRSGKILFRGADILQYSPNRLRELRKDIQLVFQDPYSSLNPRLSIGDAIGEVLSVHRAAESRQARRRRVGELLEKVSLPASYATRFPHEFSGGQRQRIVIARALALEPSFLVCDESVSALDVSIQAQVLNLLNDLKREFGFTVLFISHDLSVVHYISDRIAVMRSGRIIETGTADQVYHQPRESYTRQLIESIPGGKIISSP